MWNETLSYGQVRRRDEVELSKYYFEIADVELADAHASTATSAEARRASRPGSCCPPTRRRSPARTSSTCSTRAARSPRPTASGLIRRVRDLACACARAYVAGPRRAGSRRLGARAGGGLKRSSLRQPISGVAMSGVRLVQ